MNDGETQRAFDHTFTIGLFSVAKKNKRSFVEVAETARELAKEGLDSAQILERLRKGFSQQN
jgi:hypothetical protein